MRYKSITLKGYIGIYNGLLVNSISIDFDKCIHNLIVIKGDTGSGKSTLFKALTPLPDQSSDFIPGADAVKTIEIMHDGFYYLIEYVHAWKGESFVSKGAFYKGTCREDAILCNPNLNITACKDLVYSEFSLDPTFLELTELSNTNRGIITSTPAIRKQNFNSIISGVEIYNQIYKVLNKRSTVFKSMINSLSDKIRSIGNEELLRSSIASSNQRIAITQANIEDYIAKIAQNQATIQRLDPDGELQDKFAKDSARMKELSLDNSMITKKHPQANQDPKLIKLSIGSSSAKLQEMKEEKDTLEREVSTLINEMNDESERLNKKRAKLDSLVSVGNYSDMVERVNKLTKEVNDLEGFFNANSITNYDLSSAEFVSIMGTIEGIINAISKVIGKYSLEVRKYVITSYLSNHSIDSLPVYSTEMQDECGYIKSILSVENSELLELNNKIDQYTRLKDLADNILADRPADCTNDKCPYISKGIEMVKSLPSEEVLSRLYADRVETQTEINDYEKRLKFLEESIQAYEDIYKILITVRGQRALIEKAQISGAKTVYADVGLILHMIQEDLIPHLDQSMYDILSNVSAFDNYKVVKRDLEVLTTNLSIYEAKHELIDEIMGDIDRLESVVNNLHMSISSNNERISTLDRLIESGTQIKENLEKTYEMAVEYNTNEIAINGLNTAIKQASAAIEEINCANTTIGIFNARLIEARQQVEIFNKELSQMEYSISRLTEYQDELELFEAKYEKVEFMKKCCSPTKSGIQNIFIALYLNDIIRTANKLLSMVFSSMTLQQPVINERVFSFPCIGEGLPHDDVSSLSGGQSAIMSVVLSGSIMYHSSTKYNILKLDEVDGQLDSTLRPQFLPLIDQVRTILGCEQCFIISHNEALDLRNVDLIILKTSDPDVYNSGANIIYQY